MARVRSKKHSRQQPTAEDIMNIIYDSGSCYDKSSQYFKPCDSCVLNTSRKLINKINKNTAKQLAQIVTECLFSDLQDQFYQQYYEAINDMIKAKFYKTNAPTAEKGSKKKPEVMCKVVFNDKHIQDIDLPRIFRDKSVIECIPRMYTYNIPTVVYSYVAPIQSKVFNF